MTQLTETRAALIRAGTDTARHDDTAFGPPSSPITGLGRLLAVIDHCVLATRIIWDLDAGGRLVLEAANRRILRVCEVPQPHATLAAPLSERPLSGADAVAMAHLLQACLPRTDARGIATVPLDTLPPATPGGPGADAIAEAAGLGSMTVSASSSAALALFERLRDQGGPPPLRLACFADDVGGPAVATGDHPLEEWAERALDAMLSETCPLAAAIAAGGLVSLRYGAAGERSVLFAFDDDRCHVAAGTS